MFLGVRFPTDMNIGMAMACRLAANEVTLDSHHSVRSPKWADPIMTVDARYAVKQPSDWSKVYALWINARGPIHSFRVKNHADYTSAADILTPITITDAPLKNTLDGGNLGDGETSVFQIQKEYRFQDDDLGVLITRTKEIYLPVSGTLRASIDGVEVFDFQVNNDSGLLTFDSGGIPGPSTEPRCGYQYDELMKFDTNEISVEFNHHHEIADISTIPLISVRYASR